MAQYLYILTTQKTVRTDLRVLGLTVQSQEQQIKTCILYSNINQYTSNFQCVKTYGCSLSYAVQGLDGLLGTRK